MTSTISVRLDKPILNDLDKVEKKWKTDRSETIRRLLASAVREWKIVNAVDEIANHKISVGKATKECGLSLWELLDILRKKDTDWTNYSEDDIERDLKLIP